MMNKLEIFKEVAQKGLSIEEAMDLIRKSEGISPSGSRVFSSDDRYVTEHQVFGKKVLLGVTYCSVALDAEIGDSNMDSPIILTKLLFHKPVILDQNETVEIRRKPQKEHHSDNTRSIEACKSSETDFVLAATYEVKSVQQENIRRGDLDIGEFMRKSGQVLESDQVYQRMSDVNVLFGDSLKTVQQVWINGNAVMCELKRSPLIPDDYKAVSPVILDGAVVGSLAPFQSVEQKPFVPMMIKELIYHGNDSGVCYSCSSLSKQNSEVVVLDINIYSEKGTLLIEMKDVTLKRVNSVNVLESKDSSKPASIQDEVVSKNVDMELDGSMDELVTNYIIGRVTPILKASGTKIDTTRNFLDLGIDSNQLVVLVKDIENDLGIELYPTLFFEYQNIQEVCKYLLSNYSESLARFFNQLKSDMKQEKVKDVTSDTWEYIAPSEEEKKSIYTERKAVGTLQDNNAPFDIAIIGMEGMFGDSPDLVTFWDNLRNSRNLIKEIPSDHFDFQPWFSTDMEAKDRMYSKWGSFIPGIDKFDADFFNISPREAETMDPQLRLLLQVLYHTTEDAGLIRDIRGTKTGMFVGACFQDYSSEMGRVGKPVEPYDGSGNAQTMYSNRPSFFFDLKGPSISVDTACSSSLVAIHLACQALRNRECDMAFAAGINLLLSSGHYRYFCSIGALSPTGRCHTFDKSADGYVPGEGIAAILLKPLDKAIADGNRIHGIIKGSAVNHGGYTPSITAPSMKMEAQVVIDAWKVAGIEPETLGYIEAHGTGTKLGDPIEINALKEAFKNYTTKKDFCAIGSAKAHIGHAEGAAGIAGVIKAVLSLKNKVIPAMPMFKELNPFIDIKNSPLFINTNSIPWEVHDSLPRRAGVSSFGLGGLMRTWFWKSVMWKLNRTGRRMLRVYWCCRRKMRVD